MFTVDGYDKLQECIANKSVVEFPLPIHGLYYSISIDEDEIVFNMPYATNEFYICAGFIPRYIEFHYTDLKSLNEIIDNIRECPYHFFGMHDICPDGIYITTSEICSICQETSPLTQLINSVCNHLFHKHCLNNLVKFNTKKTLDCPMCRTNLLSTRDQHS